MSSSLKKKPEKKVGLEQQVATPSSLVESVEEFIRTGDVAKLIGAVGERRTQRLILETPRGEYTIIEAAQLMRQLPRTWVPLLIGPPGVGKTAIIRQFASEEAKERGRLFIDLTQLGSQYIKEKLLPKVRQQPEKYYLYLYVPAFRITEEFQSIPEIGSGEGKEATAWIPPAKIAPLLVQVESLIEQYPEIQELINEFLTASIHPEHPAYRQLEQKLEKYLPFGLLFIDEATQGGRFFTEQFVQQLTGERVWGDYMLSPLVRLVLAANPPEYNIAAVTFPEPVLRRIVPLRITRYSPEIFWTYMLQRYGKYGIVLPPEVYAFLKVYGQYLIPEKSMMERAVAQYSGYPNPASWEKWLGYVASALSVSKYSPEVASELLYNILGPEVARDLASFLVLKVPPPEELLANPDLWYRTIEEHVRKESGRAELIREAVRMKMLTALVHYILQNLHRKEQVADKLADFILDLATRGEEPLILELLLMLAGFGRSETELGRQVQDFTRILMTKLLQKGAARGINMHQLFLKALQILMPGVLIQGRV